MSSSDLQINFKEFLIITYTSSSNKDKTINPVSTKYLLGVQEFGIFTRDFVSQEKRTMLWAPKNREGKIGNTQFLDNKLILSNKEKED